MNCQRNYIEDYLQKQMPCDVYSIHFHQCLRHSVFKHKVKASYQLRGHQHGDKEGCNAGRQIDNRANGVGSIGEGARGIAVSNAHTNEKNECQRIESHLDGGALIGAKCTQQHGSWQECSYENE